jgi:hypothetical protein
MSDEAQIRGIDLHKWNKRMVLLPLLEVAAKLEVSIPDKTDALNHSRIRLFVGPLGEKQSSNRFLPFPLGLED